MPVVIPDIHFYPISDRLGHYVDLETADDFIGKYALRAIHKTGPDRHLLGIIMYGADAIQPYEKWYDILADGEKVGEHDERGLVAASQPEYWFCDDLKKEVCWRCR